MSTHNICFHGEIRKISILLDRKKHLSNGYDFSTYIGVKIFQQMSHMRKWTFYHVLQTKTQIRAQLFKANDVVS